MILVLIVFNNRSNRSSFRYNRSSFFVRIQAEVALYLPHQNKQTNKNMKKESVTTGKLVAYALLGFVAGFAGYYGIKFLIG